jgi:hypothetical protein
MLLSPSSAARHSGGERPAQLSFSLEKEWEVHLGPYTGRLDGQAACPDGSFIVADDEGWLSVVSPEGLLRSRARYQELRGLKSVTCGESGRVYASVTMEESGVLVAMNPVPGSGAHEARIVGPFDPLLPS